MQDIETVCKECGRKYIYNRQIRRGHTKFVCNSCTVNLRRLARRKQLVDILGGKCTRCGYSKCKEALVFHHKDETDKGFTISGNHTRSMEVLVAEVLKCELICANCHAEEHFNRREISRRSKQPFDDV